MTTTSAGVADLKRSFEFLPLTLQLAAQDVRLRYARSLLGPLWISLAMLAFSGAISFVMAGLFGGSLREIVPFVMAGIILWTFISSCIIEACSALIGARGHLLGAPLPYSTFVYAVVLRNIIYLGHHLAAYAVVAVLVGAWPNPGWLLAIPGLVLLIASVAGMVMFFSSLTPRFRDILPLVGIVMGAGMLLTPVYWRPELLRRNTFIAEMNPFTHLLAVVRQPIINEATAPNSWVVAFVTAVVCLVAGAATFVIVRRRLPFWI